MANPTTNLGMTKPTVGGSTDTWGTTLNEEVVDIIDAIFAIGGTDVTMSDVTFNSIKLQETGAGTDFIAVQAPSAVTTSYTLTMPTAVGSSGQALRASDASGSLEWYTPADVGDITEVVAGTGLSGGGTSGAVTLNVEASQTQVTAVGALDAGSITSGFGNIDVGSSTIDGGTITATTALAGTLSTAAQPNITAVGTIATGVWNGTAVTGDYLDVTTSPLANTKIWIGDSSGDAQEFALSGDVTMTAGGAVTVADNAITLAKMEDGTSGDILYYGASGVPTRLAKGSDTEVLTLSGGLPVWSAPTTGDITGVTAGAGMTGGGTSGDVTLNVIGTADRITVNADDVDIASTYVGQTSITTLGTIATGVWNGTALATAYIADNAVTLAKLEDGTQGDVLYYGASGAPARLGAGSDGQVLTSGGAGANPSWEDATTGDITGVTAGTGLSGGGTSGDVTLNVDASQTQVTAVGTLTSGVWNATAISGDYIDVTTSPLANTKIWIGDSSGDAQEFALSGDATMSAGGVVTVTAPAGTLTGSTLASGVTASSLTSVGTLASLAVTGEITVTASDNSAVLTLISTDADANYGPNLRVYRNSSSPAVNDHLGEINFEGRNDNSQDVVYANIETRIKTATDGSEDGYFDFETMVGGTLSSRMIMNETTTVINEDSLDLDFRIEGNGEANLFFVDAGNNEIGIGTNTPDGRLDVTHSQNATSNFYFQNPDTTNTSSRAYLNVVSGDRSLAMGAINADHAYINATAGANLYIQDGGTTNMVVAGDGKVGIGSNLSKEVNFSNGSQGLENVLHFEAGTDKWSLYGYDRTNSHYTDLSLAGQTLYLDASTKFLGCNTSSPGSIIDIRGSGNAGATSISDARTLAGLFMATRTSSGAGMAMGVNSDYMPYIQPMFSDDTTTRELWLSPYGGNISVNGALATAPLNVKHRLDLEPTDTSGERWSVYAHTDSTFRINYNSAGNDELMLDSAGNLAIQSGAKLQIDGGGDTYITEGSANVMRFFAGGNKQFECSDTNLAVVGELTAGTKTFRIDHPLPDMAESHTLAHACIEGPQSDLLYRGSVDLVAGYVQVDLDEVAGMTEGTFEALTRDRQCWIQNDTGWSLVRGSVEGSVLTIECQDTDSTDTVSWMVVAERNDPTYLASSTTDDDGNLIVEAEKPEPEEEEDEE